MTRYGLTMEDARENAERAEKEQAAREADHSRRAKECLKRMTQHFETELGALQEDPWTYILKVVAWEITR